MIEEDKQTLKKQIEGGEQHDERTTNVQQPIQIVDERGNYVHIAGLPKKVD
jgi:hypothetical protein